MWCVVGTNTMLASSYVHSPNNAAHNNVWLGCVVGVWLVCGWCVWLGGVWLGGVVVPPYIVHKANRFWKHTVESTYVYTKLTLTQAILSKQ